MTIGLTKRQDEALRFLCAYQAQHGTAPTFGEIAKAMGSPTKSTAARVINALQERGYIRRMPNRPRAIEILVKPDVTAPITASTLPADVQAKLTSFCIRHGERPADILHDAVVLFLDQTEARRGRTS